MAAPRTASIVVGINDYVSNYYQRPGFALRYAAADAEAFHDYVVRAWPSKDSVHILLRDRDATTEAIGAAFAKISREDSYDVLVVYFAGHGEIGNGDSGWFCAADTQPSECGVDAATLDQFLKGVRAGIAIILVDCCYAESIVAGSTYLRELGAARAKLFLCSARRNQLTYEDDAWGHGALSFLLLSALAPDSSLSKTGHEILVEGTLFPYLCEQLPLLVFREKGGAKQEPVMGGVSTTAVRLPLVGTGIRSSDSSVFEVVRARYRQFLAATAAALLFAIIANQLLLYHFAVGVDGYIQVRRGLAPLYWATIPGHGLHAETGIEARDITALDVEKASRLRNGGVWGVWTQRTAAGMRRWSDALIPYLVPSTGERLSLLTGKALPESGLNRDRYTGVQWRPDSITDAMLLNPEATEALRAKVFAQLPELTDFDCNSSVDNRYDFTLLQMSHADVLFYLAVLEGYTSRETHHTSQLLENALKLISYRARFLSRENRGKEFDTAAVEYREFLSLVDQAAARHLIVNPHEPIAGWCEPAMAALAMASTDDGRVGDTVQRLIALVDPSKSEMGDLLSFEQLAALGALELASRRGRLPDNAVRSIFEFLQDDGRGVEGHPGLVDWLRRVSSLQAFPPDLIKALQSDVERGHSEISLVQVRSFELLARNARYGQPSDREFLRLQTPRLIEENTGTSELANALGYLGCAGISVDSAIGYLGPRVTEQKVVRLNRQQVLGFDVIAAGDDFEDGLALGRIAQTASAASPLFARIEEFAVNRYGAIDQAPIVRALAVRAAEKRTLDQAVREISRSLDGSRTSVRRHQLAVAVGIETLLLLPSTQRSNAVEAVRSAWLAEAEPDLKVSWASILLQMEKRSASFDIRPCL